MRFPPLLLRAAPAGPQQRSGSGVRRPRTARSRDREPARHRAGGRADRLLLQRLRKSQSGTALYGDAQAAAEDRECAAEPSVYAAYEGAHSQRLIVVANRLPVSAFKDRDGRWALQARATRRPRPAALPARAGAGQAHAAGSAGLSAAAWAGHARCARQRRACAYV